MKILHGSVRSAVRVKVDDANATPENSRGYIPVTEGERIAGHGYYQEHGDATFGVDPDGTLYVYGDPSKPAHHSYGRNAWLWVGDENNNSVFNAAHDGGPNRATPRGRMDLVTQKRTPAPRDPNQRAASVVALATAEKGDEPKTWRDYPNGGTLPPLRFPPDGHIDDQRSRPNDLDHEGERDRLGAVKVEPE